MVLVSERRICLGVSNVGSFQFAACGNSFYGGGGHAYARKDVVIDPCSRKSISWNIPTRASPVLRTQRSRNEEWNF